MAKRKQTYRLMEDERKQIRIIFCKVLVFHKKTINLDLGNLNRRLKYADTQRDVFRSNVVVP